MKIIINVTKITFTNKKCYDIMSARGNLSNNFHVCSYCLGGVKQAGLTVCRDGIIIKVCSDKVNFAEWNLRWHKKDRYPKTDRKGENL